MDTPLTPDTPAIRYAARYLARYPTTTGGLRTKMRAKGFGTDEIDEAVAVMCTSGLLDDRLFVKGYLQSQVVIRGKPLGPTIAKLSAKGADRDVIDEYVDTEQAALDEGMCSGIADHRDRYQARGLDNPHEVIRKICAKGYPFALVKSVIEQSEE